MSNIAELSLNEVTQKWQATYQGKILAASPNKHYVKMKIRNGNYPNAHVLKVRDVREVTSTPIVVTNNENSATEFGINERFDFLTDFVKMVEDGTSPSLLVTGEGGLGKTYTVNKALNEAGRELLHLEGLPVGAKINDSDYYTVVKGYSTAKGLYRTLWENRNRIVVFDDCDSILKDQVALNILKGALDSYDKRIISWNAEMSEKDELPRSFEFKGGVIFISNLPVHKIDQAIRSRAICIDLSMTQQQKIDRMEVLIAAPEFLPEYSKAVKREALDFLADMKDRARELSLRTLIQVVKVASRGDNWQRRAEYLLTAV